MTDWGDWSLNNAAEMDPLLEDMKSDDIIDICEVGNMESNQNGDQVLPVIISSFFHTTQSCVFLSLPVKLNNVNVYIVHWLVSSYKITLILNTVGLFFYLADTQRCH